MQIKIQRLLKETVMLKVKQLSSLVKVFSDEEPKAKVFEKLSIFRNEKASLQIALTSDCDSKVSVEIKSPFGQMLKIGRAHV